METRGRVDAWAKNSAAELSINIHEWGEESEATCRAKYSGSLAQRLAINSIGEASLSLSVQRLQGPIGNTALKMRDGRRNQMDATDAAPSTGIFRDACGVPSRPECTVEMR